MLLAVRDSKSKELILECDEPVQQADSINAPGSGLLQFRLAASDKQHMLSNRMSLAQGPANQQATPLGLLAPAPRKRSDQKGSKAMVFPEQASALSKPTVPRKFVEQQATLPELRAAQELGNGLRKQNLANSSLKKNVSPAVLRPPSTSEAREARGFDGRQDRAGQRSAQFNALSRNSVTSQRPIAKKNWDLVLPPEIREQQDMIAEALAIGEAIARRYDMLEEPVLDGQKNLITNKGAPREPAPSRRLVMGGVPMSKSRRPDQDQNEGALDRRSVKKSRSDALRPDYQNTIGIEERARQEGPLHRGSVITEVQMPKSRRLDQDQNEGTFDRRGVKESGSEALRPDYQNTIGIGERARQEGALHRGHDISEVPMPKPRRLDRKKPILAQRGVKESRSEVRMPGYQNKIGIEKKARQEGALDRGRAMEEVPASPLLANIRFCACGAAISNETSYCRKCGAPVPKQ